MRQPMSRDEHLNWAKQRALEYLKENDLPHAVISMGSDLSKHPDFHGPAYDGLFQLGMLTIQRGPREVERWIKGFR